MKTPHFPLTRRDFLGDVGRGVVTAAIGLNMARELGLAAAVTEEAAQRLEFGPIEPLVRLMQETPATKLLPILAARLRSGTSLKELVTAGALANARTFGGEDYVGFHTMMALAPSFHMARQQTPEEQALPVFKVLYRNTNRIQEVGGPTAEVLHSVVPSAETSSATPGEQLRAAVRAKDGARAEAIFAAVAQTPEDALDALLYEVQDETEVHRVALPYRAWDLLGLIGREHATTLLRQSVRYCVNSEKRWAQNRSRDLLARLLEEHKLLDRAPGTRTADDAWVEALSVTIFKATPEQAATAAATALAEGFAPDAIGEAITLAANQIILRDHGRTPMMEVPGKPVGSVHGDSIGLHACDSAGAWRNLARAARPRNAFACLILGAYQVALDRAERGGDFLNWEPLPLANRLREVKTTEPAALLGELDEAVRGNLQTRATSIVHRYEEGGHEPRAVFDLLRKYAISEDGALHAEKFYQTAAEEFANTRAKFRWRHLCALARVTASEYGRPAPGMAEARELVKGLQIRT
jgi:hypothetical protein